MKTQEKNFDGIKLSGFTAILIMLALTGTAIYLLSLPQTPSIIAGVICGICVVVMLPRIYDHPAKQFARIDFFRQICRNGHK